MAGSKPLPRECRVCGTKTGLIPDPQKPGGVKRQCYPCRWDEQRLARSVPERREKMRAYRKAWRDANKDWHRKQVARWSAEARANPDPWRAAVGAAVKAWRAEHGVSQVSLSAALGLSQSRWGKMELGIRPWPDDVLRRLRHAGIPVPDGGDRQGRRRYPPRDD
jgi:hypothetical protein